MFNQFDPTVRATIKYLQLLNVNVSNKTVNETLQNHPDWPSFLSITDSLAKWNVPNAVGTLNPKDIDELPTPFLSKIDDNILSEAPLGIITDVSDTEVSMYQGSNQKFKKVSKSEFIQKWSGVYIIAEPDSNSGELNYQTNVRNELFQNIIPWVAITLLVLLFFSLISRSISTLSIDTHMATLGIYVQCLIALLGAATTILLAWHEIDQNNPILKKVCSGLAKSDCGAILTSSKAKIFSWLSWSEVGLFFFIGSLLIVLFGSYNINESTGLVAWWNVLALPYTIFSIYYQGKVIKQWCILCLVVQALLIAGFINGLLSGFLHTFNTLNIFLFLKSLLIYSIPAFTWFSIKPYLMRMQEGKNTKRQFLRLKFNSEIFDTLLKNQKSINHSLDNIGIELGNPNATNTIVKVCSTYCGPCSKAHPELEKLLELNSNLKVKIIFLANNLHSDPALKPMRHLLAIAEKKDHIMLKKALNDWYLPNDKNYARFASQYPIDENLINQNVNINAMNDWCTSTGITYTPTVFLNGFQLPSSYGIEDLHYFLLDSSV